MQDPVITGAQTIDTVLVTDTVWVLRQLTDASRSVAVQPGTAAVEWIAGLSTLAVAMFALVTWWNGRQERKQRQADADARVAVGADIVRRRLNSIINEGVVAGVSVAWATGDSFKDLGNYYDELVVLVKDGVGASPAVTKALTKAYDRIVWAGDRRTWLVRQLKAGKPVDPEGKTNEQLATEISVALTDCVNHLRDVASTGLKLTSYKKRGKVAR